MYECIHVYMCLTDTPNPQSFLLFLRIYQYIMVIQKFIYDNFIIWISLVCLYYILFLLIFYHIILYFRRLGYFCLSAEHGIQ